jgi:excisionase family DNA binding protein
MAQETRTDKGAQKAQRIGSPIQKRLFTLKEASQYLGRPVSGVRTLIWRGRLPYIQEGRKQYIDIRDMDSFIERSKSTMI